MFDNSFELHFTYEKTTPSTEQEYDFSHSESCGVLPWNNKEAKATADGINSLREFCNDNPDHPFCEKDWL
ncbi:hypothetical protein [Natrinema sp. 1APR25-10V2]|uniref:hypothetical protein n=1 Tax=Natrinema sp. 1APR25-10V2 TaxID=2951081 RepID=UPI0028740F38|nr:hypothetical protein [Natrinema sp. 1APR25-10V2]MDS0474589.1 hypothetical protein [Natrinema sp. 1APR25-10V2]